ncbi:hypothetical protein [Acinetobacter haemolyticus]|uniref:hypothetical protein n=1 Tax=Acinetobacter haemolyticus TaxID=29430 RepID=UPI0002CD74DF|nr:hypothetical protein [Acinetobacter haemolyticus]ENW19121.1 hypothetical protein F926_02681 [Acinetobacter haemolyticus NIPH 261]NAR67702.1 hypothetical protein [Acinetobacter haemolyticus]NAR84324.1 hypothetical protein [Acinetobacter haemolyticus]
MSIGYFPDKRNERKTIVMIDHNDLRDCLSNRENSKFLRDDDIYYLPVPVDPDEIKSSAVLAQLDRENKLQKNKILILDDSNDTDNYELSNKVISESPLKKIENFANFCSVLGAKELTFEIEKSDQDYSKISGSVSGGASEFAEAEMGMSREMKDKIRQKIKKEYRWAGSEPDLEKAEQLFHQYRLEREDGLGDLLGLMKNSKNPLKRKVIHLDITRDLTDTVKIFAKAKFPKIPKLAGLKTEFSNIKNIDTSLSLKVTVIFQDD